MPAGGIPVGVAHSTPSLADLVAMRDPRAEVFIAELHDAALKDNEKFDAEKNSSSAPGPRDPSLDKDHDLGERGTL